MQLIATNKQMQQTSSNAEEFHRQQCPFDKYECSNLTLFLHIIFTGKWCLLAQREWHCVWDLLEQVYYQRNIETPIFSNHFISLKGTNEGKDRSWHGDCDESITRDVALPPGGLILYLFYCLFVCWYFCLLIYLLVCLFVYLAWWLWWKHYLSCGIQTRWPDPRLCNTISCKYWQFVILLTVNSNAVAENGIDFIEDTGVRYGSFYPPRVCRQFAQEATLVKVNHQASLGVT